MLSAGAVQPVVMQTRNPEGTGAVFRPGQLINGKVRKLFAQGVAERYK